MAQDGTKKWEPSPRQRALLESAQEGGYNRSLIAICKSARVPRRTVYNWFDSDPDFAKEWADAPKRELHRHLPGAWLALIKKANKGDTTAIRLLFEIAGIYVPTAKQEFSGGLTLEQLILGTGNGKSNGHTQQELPPFRKLG